MALGRLGCSGLLIQNEVDFGLNLRRISIECRASLYRFVGMRCGRKVPIDWRQFSIGVTYKSLFFNCLIMQHLSDHGFKKHQ